MKGQMNRRNSRNTDQWADKYPPSEHVFSSNFTLTICSKNKLQVIPAHSIDYETSYICLKKKKKSLNEHKHTVFLPERAFYL